MRAGFFKACLFLSSCSIQGMANAFAVSSPRQTASCLREPFTTVPISNQKTMPTESSIVVEGKITAVLPGTMFRVELSNKHLVLAHISGKMRKRFIRLTVGDRVKMEMSPYDVTKARIVYRL
jgi:translation initiation factor IF-1